MIIKATISYKTSQGTKRQAFDYPTTVEEMSYGAYLKTLALSADSSSTNAQFLSAITGVPEHVFRGAKQQPVRDLVDKIQLWDDLHIEDVLRRPPDAIPDHVRIGDKDVALNKDVGQHTYHAFEYSRAHLRANLAGLSSEEDDLSVEQVQKLGMALVKSMPTAMAAYLWQDFSGAAEFDELAVARFEKTILSLPVSVVFPVGRFFLTKLEPIKRGGAKKQKKSKTSVKGQTTQG